MVYESVLKDDTFFNSKVIRDLEKFKQMSDVIVSNRLDDNLKDIPEKFIPEIYLLGIN